MADLEIKDLQVSEGLSTTDVIAEQRDTGGDIWVTRKFTLGALGLFVNKVLQYASDLHTTNKTIIGAINELEAGGGGGGGTANLTELTQAEYDALEQAGELEEDMMYFITDANGDGSQFQPVIYSTSEREIGVWTDGKPLYEKTIHIQPNGNTQDYTNAEAISNIEVVVDCEFLAKRQDSGNVWYYTGNGSTYPESINYSQYKLGVRVSGGYVQYYINGYDTEITDIWATVQYTKSTDTAGSGTWTPQGVPSQHYSTTEQVVGTWVDGSTLYEKTFEYSGSYTGSVDLTNQFSGIDECFITEAFCINQSDAILPLPYSHTSSGNTITLFINSTKTGFGIRVGTDQTLSRIVIVMRYTKSSS